MPKAKRGVLDWLRPKKTPPLPSLSTTIPQATVSHEPIKTALVQRFEDVEEIGRGGMATVRMVRDTNLLREVAMKVLDPDLAKNAASVQSFIEEAQITGQIDHPYIVPIHELGVDPNGLPYFTMKVVRGETLSQWLEEPGHEVGSTERLIGALEIVMKVCEALSFAHSRGVIHRDLKPTNIMVGEFGEVYLMDWGLARLTSDPGVRVSRPPDGPLSNVKEGAVGTPAFMAPEQARGATAEMDERTDVFGVGIVLYLIVTGAYPFMASNVREMLLIAAECRFKPPQDLELGIPKRLCEIINKAMSRERADRYPTIADLKADLHRFLRAGHHLPRREFAVGDRIVTEGELGDCAFIIVDGECDAYKTVNGEKRVLRRMGPGDVFGEMAILSSLPRTASVEAVGPVAALVVCRSVLEEGLGIDSWIGSLVKTLALRFRELDQRATAK